jgi:hypothetical protein
MRFFTIAVLFLYVCLTAGVHPVRAQDGTPYAPVVADKPTVPDPVVAEGSPDAAAGPVATYFPILPYDADPEATPQLLPLASNYPLDGDHSQITRAIIAIHDVNRDAGGTLGVLTTLAGAAGDHTLIIAPQFLLESDIAHFAGDLPSNGQDLARWPLSAWEDGGDSTPHNGQRGISSFTAMDMVVLFLGDKAFFPNLTDIVIAGHGAGADFALRYAATGQAPDLVFETSHVRYVAANASSYLYVTPARPQITNPGFAPADNVKCPSYNSYKYGILYLNEYAKRLGGSAIQLRYPSRQVMYMAGEKVASDDHYPDTSCAAEMQGPNRLARMMNYNTYLGTAFGDSISKNQNFSGVVKTGYDPAAMFGSRCGMVGLFGDGDCQPEPIRGTETLR